MPGQPFRFREHRPADAVAPWVARYWEFHVHPGAPAVHHVPPDGCTSLLVSLIPGRPPSVVVSGPWIEPLALPIEVGARYVGIRFLPGAASAWFGVQAAAFVNQITPASTFLGAEAEALGALVVRHVETPALADALSEFLEALPAAPAAPDPVVQRAVACIVAEHGARPVAETAVRCGTSTRTLSRRFGRATGLTPKQFARIQRLRAAAFAMTRDTGTLSRIAAALGYADQAHLTHDAVTLLGLTPAMLRQMTAATQLDGVDP